MGRTARVCGAGGLAFVLAVVVDTAAVHPAPTVHVDGAVESVSRAIVTVRTEAVCSVRVDFSTMQLHPGSLLLVPARSIAVWGKGMADSLAAHGLALESRGRRG